MERWEHTKAHAADAASSEILRESLQQLVAILRAVFAALLEFDDVGADEPVAQDEALVDRRQLTFRPGGFRANGLPSLALGWAVAHFAAVSDSRLLGSGIYTVPEASRLSRVSSARIRRWLKGYDFKSKQERHHSNPVWTGQFGALEDKLAVGFLDLMEIRFVRAFLERGVSWKTMRDAHLAANLKLGTDHPFCAHRFATDGRAILLQQAQESGDVSLVNITDDQREFERIVAPFLKELEFADGVTRWWPLGREREVVVDPIRNLGQPTVNRSGVPTRVLARSVKANGSIESVVRWFEVAPEEVRDAVEFERTLAA